MFDFCHLKLQLSRKMISDLIGGTRNLFHSQIFTQSLELIKSRKIKPYQAIYKVARSNLRINSYTSESYLVPKILSPASPRPGQM